MANIEKKNFTFEEVWAIEEALNIKLDSENSVKLTNGEFTEELEFDLDGPKKANIQLTRDPETFELKINFIFNDKELNVERDLNVLKSLDEFSFDLAKSLIEKYKNHPEVTEQQIQIILDNTYFDKYLATSEISLAFLDTDYASKNRIKKENKNKFIPPRFNLFRKTNPLTILLGKHHLGRLNEKIDDIRLKHIAMGDVPNKELNLQKEIQPIEEEITPIHKYFRKKGIEIRKSERTEKSMNFPSVKIEDPMVRLKNITDLSNGQMEELIRSNAHNTDITEKQIDYLLYKTDLHENLSSTGVMDELLKTDYAKNNGIDKSINPDDTNFNPLKLLLASVTIKALENENTLMASKSFLENYQLHKERDLFSKVIQKGPAYFSNIMHELRMDPNQETDILKKYGLFELHTKLRELYTEASEERRFDNFESARLIDKRANKLEEEYKDIVVNSLKEIHSKIGRDLEKEFANALDSRDWKTINKLAKEDNFSPSIDFLVSRKNAAYPNTLYPKDIAALETIFNIKIDDKAVNSTKEQKEKGKEQNQSVGMKIRDAGNLAQQAFNNM